MGLMFGKFKGHQVSKSTAPLDGGKPLTRAELQTRIAEKRKAAKDKEAQTLGQTGEQGGPEGPEPTRYGDWEVGGRVSDF